MLTLLALLVPLAPFCASQIVGGESEILFEWSGNYLFASSVADSEDINGDGINDILVGAPGNSPGGLQNAGSVFLYSGADGSTLGIIHGQSPGSKLGEVVVSAGDVDGDGIPDVLIGSEDIGSSGAAYVYSGANGSLLYSWFGNSATMLFGSAISAVGDVSQDGFDDVLVGAPQADPQGHFNAGSAFLYSGATGQLLQRFDGEVNSSGFGSSVSSAGDVDADGVPDILIGAPYTDLFLTISLGKAYVFSGATGQLLLEWNGTIPEMALGSSVSALGDINQDGFDDVLIGAPFTSSLGTINIGRAFAYSGADGSLLHRFRTDAMGDGFGTALSGGQDFDGDGIPDLAIGAKFAPDGGEVYTYSGADGSMIRKIDAFGHRLGSSIAMTCDLDGDGLAELLVASQRDQGGVGTPGAAYAISNRPFLFADVHAVSASAGGTLNLELRFPEAAALNEYKVLLSGSGKGPTFYGVEIPLTLDNIMGMSFLGHYPVPVHSNLHGTLNANSEGFASITIPPGLPSGAIGRVFYFAAITNSPGQLPDFSSIAVPIRITL